MPSISAEPRSPARRLSSSTPQERVASSDALRDRIREVNRGPDVWFVRDDAELRNRLTPAGE